MNELKTIPSDSTLDRIGRVAHEANRAYSKAIGQEEQPGWDDAPDWMRDATFAGILHRINQPDASVKSQHDIWLEEKRSAGWKYGEVKDPAAKTHPMMISYEDLPETEKLKDDLFAAIVTALYQPQN